MDLALETFVKHAVIDRMNKQFLNVMVVNVMFNRNNCMENMYSVHYIVNVVANSMMLSALLLMYRENLFLCLYGAILPP